MQPQPSLSPRVPALALVAGLAAMVAACAARGESSLLTLSISGDQDTRVSGQCLIRMPEGNWVLQLNAAVPVTRSWQAQGLRCELDARGPVTVEVVRGGTSSRSSSDGGRIMIELR